MEVKRASGMDPLPALWESVELSDQCYAADLDGEVQVLFGTNPIEGPLGGIWMLGSEAIEANARSFWCHCKYYLAAFHDAYPALTNFVDMEHDSAHRWMRKLGFKPIQVVDLNGHLFMQYLSEADNV